MKLFQVRVVTSGVQYCSYLTYLRNLAFHGEGIATFTLLQFFTGHLVRKEFCGVMESKGRKGQCLYNKKLERDPQYKGWVCALEAILEYPFTGKMLDVLAPWSRSE